MEIQSSNNPSFAAQPVNANAAALTPPQTEFSIFGVIKMPIKHASTVASVGAVFTVLFLLDLFFDINPVKGAYQQVFPPKEDETPSPS